MFQYPNSQIRTPADVIDLGLGDPQFALLPLDAIHRSAERFFAHADPGPLQYGAEQGDARLRAALAQTLTPGYGFAVDPDTLFITNGASQGLDLLCSLYTRPGDTIFIEEPSYFLALRIFRDHGLRMIALPVDEHGLSLAALEDALKHTKPALLYTIPTYQNPSGRTLSARRRSRLVELSQEHGFILAADEVYHLLSFASPPPPPLAASSHLENVVSLGSFSKILAPGLRLGWLQAHPNRLHRLADSGLLHSGGGLNPFTSAMLRELVESGGLSANITRLRQEYAGRAAVMAAALRAHLPGATFHTPEGGFFFWVQLPGGMDARELSERAKEFKAGFRAGGLFSSQDGLNDWMRLCFAFYGPEEIEEGVRRLGQAFSALVASQSSR